MNNETQQLLLRRWARSKLSIYPLDAQLAEDIEAALARPQRAPDSVSGCTRSHPHEDMSEVCKLKTQVAKLTNQLAILQAKPQQEPVWYTNTLDAECDTPKVISYAEKHGGAIEAVDCKIPLYASPPTREPLSKEEIDTVAYKAIRNGQLSWVGFKKDEWGVYCLPVLSDCHYQLIRVSEAAHGIGVKP